MKEFNEYMEAAAKPLKQKKYFMVGDLIKLLSTVDKSLPIGRSGHYGEFHEMSAEDFGLDQDTNYRTQEKFKFFGITPPYIGEEPD